MENFTQKSLYSVNGIKPFIDEINQQGDKYLRYFLIGNFLFGLVLTPFYDTGLIAIGIGSLCLFAYYLAKIALPDHTLHRYVASIVFGVFMAQFIYQMHGMFEMHFFAFVGAVFLIVYQNWKLQIPLLLVIVVHHSLFAYLQYMGNQEVYFTQLDYMNFQTFIFHAVLAGLIIGICAFWCYNLRNNTIEMAKNALLLREQLDTSQKSIAFAEAIINRNFDFIHTCAEGDELGKSLIRMRESLVKVSQKEEEDRFVNVGLAEVAHILRTSATNINALSVELIKKLVKYMNVNQGGLFVLAEGENPNLVLSGCYAFDRVKYQKKTIQIGEGLLGQAMLEKDTIYITDLPENYIHITSGLGRANPRSILIVPLKTNEQMVGAIEIASFNEIPAFKINFMEKVAESIAATLISARINEKTSKLLDEFQIMNEQMRSQEEEMRQNMEELQATQEEAERKIQEFEVIIEEKNRIIQSLQGKAQPVQ